MYLFSRRARLKPGADADSVAWAASICPKVQEVTGSEVQLWATTWSAGFGTLSWTGWFSDLASLEAMGDELQADAGYNDLVSHGVDHLDGMPDDAVLQPIFGEPDPTEEIGYVVGVTAVVAGGNGLRAMTAGVGLAEQSERITGRRTLFVQSLTGPYGGVGWLTGHTSAASIEAALAAMAADEGWLAAIDATDGCFVADPNLTQSTIYRRLA